MHLLVPMESPYNKKEKGKYLTTSDIEYSIINKE